MKQCAKFQFIFLFIVAFFLLFSLPAQSHPMTIDEIEYELETITMTIEDCESDFDRIAKEISELENRDDAPPIYDDYFGGFNCNCKPELDELGKELDKLANPGANVIISEEERKKIEELKIKLDELEERNDNLQKRKKEFEARVKKLKEAARNSEPSELASEINKIVKPEIEKEFGKVEDRITHDQIKIWGHLIGIEYLMQEGKRLDDTWGHKIVKALGRLGITATIEGNSVRADGQKIAGKIASSFQFVKAEDIEGEALATRVVCTINILRE